MHLVDRVMQPGTRRGGPRTPTSGFDRSNPSVTAHEIAERNTSQRADTVATDTPQPCQRTIAARTTPAVNVSKGRRATGSATRSSTTWRCEVYVAGFHGCGPAMNRVRSSTTFNPGMSDDPTRPIP